MDPRKLSLAEKAALSPKELRLMIRRGEWPADMGPDFCCEGYSQHAVVMLPKDYAFEFLTFCIRNPHGLYVTEVCDPGDPHPRLIAPDADIRTDCNRYRVYKHGEVVDEPRDVLKYWRDDLVTFILPCSLGFEGVLRKNNVKFRILGAFLSNLKAIPAGRFKCDNMWVTCRAFQSRRDAIRAIQITSRLPATHGSPVHIGDPAYIGIKNILKPDRWVSPTPSHPLEPHEVLLYWVCALTPEIAIEAAKLPFAIMMYTGMVFVSDKLTEEQAYNEELGSNLV